MSLGRGEIGLFLMVPVASCSHLYIFYGVLHDIFVGFLKYKMGVPLNHPFEDVPL